MSDGEPIIFPILFRFHRDVVPAGIEMIKVWRIRHVGGNFFEIPEARGGQRTLHWIIDGHGRYREAKVVGASLTWLRWLSWLWVFSRTRYELAPGRIVTVAELRSLVTRSNRDPEKSSARSFAYYLSKLPADGTFTEAQFRTFMREPTEEVRITFP